MWSNNFDDHKKKTLEMHLTLFVKIQTQIIKKNFQTNKHPTNKKLFCKRTKINEDNFDLCDEIIKQNSKFHLTKIYDGSVWDLLLFDRKTQMEKLKQNKRTNNVFKKNKKSKAAHTLIALDPGQLIVENLWWYDY